MCCFHVVLLGCQLRSKDSDESKVKEEDLYLVAAVSVANKDFESFLSEIPAVYYMEIKISKSRDKVEIVYRDRSKVDSDCIPSSDIVLIK